MTHPKIKQFTFNTSQRDKYGRKKPRCCYQQMYGLYIFVNHRSVKVGWYCRRCGYMVKEKAV